jgi:invasion protein IalB
MKLSNSIALFLFATIAIFSFPKNLIAQSTDNLKDVTTTRHKNWAVTCQSAKNKDLSSCFMYQQLLVKNSNDILLSMTVDKPPALNKPRVIIRIPLGTYVSPGLSFQIDKGTALRFDIEYCDNNGCYAGMELNDGMLNLLKRGNLVRVSFQHRNRSNINLPISLSGFSSALKALN